MDNKNGEKVSMTVALKELPAWAQIVLASNPWGRIIGLTGTIRGKVSVEDGTVMLWSTTGVTVGPKDLK